VDGRVAEIESLRRFHPEARTLLIVGAEKFARITFDAKGGYRRMRRNSSCAVGTGSFLDQQAARLGLAGGSAELAARALANTGGFPAIASRCSVFAKTDLIHAQAEGFSVEEICDGLCHGLARNIADTLFPGEVPEPPIFMAGGVAGNAAVRKHLAGFAGSELPPDGRARIYGAIGAALRLLAGGGVAPRSFALGATKVEATASREYANPALEAPGPSYPDFGSLRRYLHVARKNGPSNPVEVDLYLDPHNYDEILRAGGRGPRKGEDDALALLLGVDVGSTSTKAALLLPDGRVFAGFYTRTAGQPLEATQSIFEAIDRVETGMGTRFRVTIAATTGSGRKLVGSVVGADAMIDEITAHARAAVELDPEVDTIIEIGGQDSKFTVLKDGAVTFSQMNTVCAAGTGSFLEEQAARLGVALEDFSERALGNRAPLTSDRCTVFMERDLNHFQGLGYESGELLAASLFSVCDNYLSKVAREGSIGKRIAFQGATARNRALVSALQRRLGKPLLVSKFCHLTGAIGAALEARDEARRDTAKTSHAGAPRSSAFRGFGLHALDLVSRSERCGLCPNDCRLRLIDVGGEEVAYGFLCGRDQATRHFVKGGGRDLLAERKAAIAAAYREARKGSFPKLGYPTVGIPSSLYLAEDAPFWRAFFERLGFPVVVADEDAETLRVGKRLAGAEFCAPMALFHGQAEALLASANLAFLPIYLEDKPERHDGQNVRRYYCNYSQYASVVARAAEARERSRMLCPILSGRSGDSSKAMVELRKSLAAGLAGWGIKAPSKRRLDEAYAACLEARRKASEDVARIFAEGSEGGDLAVVLIGRPYAVLSEAMGKGIVDLVRKRAVECWYSDMLPISSSGTAGAEGGSAVEPLLAAFHWRYASEVLESADFCARHARFYPIFVTSFKCAPDSFALEWFRRILGEAGKPYLVLQIDDHDSSVGYETRIEAGLRSFRNHFAKAGSNGEGRRSVSHNAAFLAPNGDPRGKTLLFPNWDPLVCPLLAANLRGQGFDARILEESPGSIRRAMSANSGQCIPVNMIAEDAIEEIERQGLDPARAVIWVGAGTWPCNLPLYPHYIKALMERRGGGMEKVEVFNCEITFLAFGPRATIGAFHAFTAGGTLRRIACRTRPYELEEGATDRLAIRAMDILVRCFESGANRERAYHEAFDPFLDLPTRPRDRPKVAIFGDLYSRDNDVLNQGLEKAIEKAGGEVITTSYIEYLKGVMDPLFRKLVTDRRYGEWAINRAALAVVAAIDRSLSLKAGAIFGKPTSWKNPDYADKLRLFGIEPDHEGECFDNTLKLLRILELHPDLSLFVQANPAFCCPSIVTEAMSKEIERITGVPVVTITYDGTGAVKNDAIEPYLAFGRRPLSRP
jgi:predicted CoA-substrate-specific enzyme activase